MARTMTGTLSSAEINSRSRSGSDVSAFSGRATVGSAAV